MSKQTYYRLVGLFEIEELEPEKIWTETEEFIVYMPCGAHGYTCFLMKEKLFTSITDAAEEAYAAIDEVINKQYDAINQIEANIKHLKSERDKFLQKML